MTNVTTNEASERADRLDRVDRADRPERHVEAAELSRPVGAIVALAVNARNRFDATSRTAPGGLM
ncbi:hypothetical protein [Streptomyces sp. NBC_01190]|uniref:hypothetical protein n=1 Tax=Streptomyces sp. NBC_01190 TaxID=2903767 RepID=UPI0038646E4E|nr:hypothetical protein OG519_11425 [Streptomyces sp. NBC_01190]